MDNTLSGPLPAERNLIGTASIKAQSAASSVIELTVPAAGVDTKITLLGNVATAGYVPATPGDAYAWTNALSYVAFGIWELNQLPSRRSAVAYAFGYETPVAAMPTTGSASYTGIGKALARVFFIDTTGTWSSSTKNQLIWVDIQGDAQLTADFATGKIDGEFSNMKGDVWKNGFFAAWNEVTVSATIAPGSNRFSGTTRTTTPGVLDQSPAALTGSATGFIDGGFYGPAGENLGAVWSLGDGRARAIGAVGAGR